MKIVCTLGSQEYYMDADEDAIAIKSVVNLWYVLMYSDDRVSMSLVGEIRVDLQM